MGDRGNGESVGEIEQKLVAIYRDLLGVPIGERDNFFDLGGDSIVAYELISRVAQAFNVELPLQVVYSYPMPCTLATEVLRLIDPDAAGTPA